MADLNEEREILLPEDDNQQVLDSSLENHELGVSRHVDGSFPSEIAQGTYLHDLMHATKGSIILYQ